MVHCSSPIRPFHFGVYVVLVLGFVMLIHTTLHNHLADGLEGLAVFFLRGIAGQRTTHVC